MVIHLHPLRSRIVDMEHKLKVAMDGLVKKIKIAASSQPPPGKLPVILQTKIVFQSLFLKCC